MSDLTDLRAKYKEVVGKNASPSWDAAELQKRIDNHRPGSEPAELSEAGEDKPAAPFPSQDDLDAMRNGTYENRELKSR